jgi:hypothetical protein
MHAQEMIGTTNLNTMCGMVHLTEFVIKSGSCSSNNCLRDLAGFQACCVDSNASSPLRWADQIACSCCSVASKRPNQSDKRLLPGRNQ